jgi:hypothetical protein
VASVPRRRRRDDAERAEAERVEAEQVQTEQAEQVEAESAGGDVRPGFDRGHGPFDDSEVDAEARASRLDLGAMLLPGLEGVELRIDIDEVTGAVVAVTAVLGDTALQVQPFAAPRRSGIWDEVRAEIVAGITEQGGTTRLDDGAFGTELHAHVPVAMPDGSSGVSPARFIGVDGPRWFLRGVVTCQGAEEQSAAQPLEEFFRAIVVVRGGEAMAPREPLELRLPDQAVAQGIGQPPADQPQSADDLNPFERGPEITEIR